VSLYAFDPDRRRLVVVWRATVGSYAHVVAEFDATVADGDAGALCAALTRLSEALWGTYVRPPSAADDDEERARREDELQQVDGVVTAVRRPNLPDESGALIGSYSPVEESAHRLGRLLHRLADAGLVDAVVADVQLEIDAVIRAELGDLSGRAMQAVALRRRRRRLRTARWCRCRRRDDAGVAEHLLDDLHVDAGGEGQGGGAVAQVVQPLLGWGPACAIPPTAPAACAAVISH
jgi:hypothetical protein